MKGFAAPAAITSAMALLLSSASLAQQNDAPRPGGAGRLQLVARFEHQVTGVTVAADERISIRTNWSSDGAVADCAAGSEARVMTASTVCTAPLLAPFSIKRARISCRPSFTFIDLRPSLVGGTCLSPPV